MKYIPIDDLEVYKIAMEIGEEIWTIVDHWSEFPKRVVGAQYCQAGDSIAANIAEAHGRFHFKDKKNFCFFSRGSLLETKSWTKKSHNRKLLDDDTFSRLNDKLKRCHYLLNQYIKSIGTTGDENDMMKEPVAPFYGLPINFDEFNDFS